MKKILISLMVLFLIAGAVFAEPAAKSVVIKSSVDPVIPIPGTGDVPGDVPTITDGSSFGYYIKDASGNLISGEIDVPTKVSASGTYVFKLFYFGKEAKGTKHTVEAKVTEPGWKLEGADVPTDAQKNAITVTSAAETLSGSVTADKPADAKVRTTFGNNSSSPIEAGSAVQVGTYTLSWGANSALEVGEYKATVTFTTTAG